MVRFYFDIRDSRGFHGDHFGTELADLEEARDQCQSLLPDLMADEPLDGDLCVIVCDVRDEAGRLVYRGEITFRGARLTT